ncbi:MAG: acyltransferase [Methylococcaceae bacterium]|nr:acyltransferase [Methylococcaceae bacterium]
MKSTGRIVAVQYLRAIAAMFVAITHLVPMLPSGLTFADWRVRVFGVGTDILLVASGFFAWRMTMAREARPLGWFWTRLVRLVPMYWLTLLALLVIQEGRDVVQPDGYQILAAFLFIPAYNGSGEISPFFTPGWAMNLILIFTFSFAISLTVRASRQRLVFLSLLIMGAVGLRFVVPRNNPVLFFYTSPILLEFLAGVLIAASLSRLKDKSFTPLLAAACIICALAYLAIVSPRFWPDGARLLRTGIPAMMIFLGVICLEPQISRLSSYLGWLRTVGDSSYCIYLSHPIIMKPVVIAIMALGIDSLALNVIMGLAVFSLFGVACYTYIELPVAGKLQALLAPRARPVLAPASSGDFLK